MGASGIVNAVRPTLEATYGKWDFFPFLVEPNIRDADAQLRGTKRVPLPPPPR